MKRLLAVLLAASMLLIVAGCGGTTSSSAPAPSGSEPAPAPSGSEPAPVEFSVAMVTDSGGVSDQSFNQSAWEGLQQFQLDTKAQTKYLESTQESDYGPNLDKLSDEAHNLIWGIGYMMESAIVNAATQNPDKLYAIVDSAPANAPSNLTGLVFKAQEPSFLVGYVAAKTTKTDKLGFVGGMKGFVIDQFEYGFRAGVAYAAKELGKEIDVAVQYAESWGDSTKGKAIATQMFTEGADIVFHAAGGTGIGVIDAAKELGKFAIGVDRDQSDLAPENVLTSALKNVGQGMYLVSKDVMDGKTPDPVVSLGLKEGGVGIVKSSLIAADVITAEEAVEDKIISGEIVVPANEEEYNAFIESLK